MHIFMCIYIYIYIYVCIQRSARTWQRRDIGVPSQVSLVRFLYMHICMYTKVGENVEKKGNRRPNPG